MMKVVLRFSNVSLWCILLFFAWTTWAQDKKKLPNPINTPTYTEYAPSITADGQTLVYQSDQYGLFVNANKKVPQISADGKSEKWIDEYETSFFGIYEVKLHPSGEWMKPQNIDAINLFANEFMAPVMGGPTISYDGNTIYFFANFGKNGYGREDIYVSYRTKNSWTKPENIGPTINTNGYEGFPSISPDGKKLYFTREILGKRVEDKQCYRIMVSEKGRNGQWRTPYELPAPVNMNCEKAPRILADGKTLVFSSIKEGGKGDFDLYKSSFQENGTWSEPQALEFVNTKKSDLFVSISPCGDKMYYVSNGDIYETVVPESLRPVKSATIQGFVLDSMSKAPVSSKVVIKYKETGETYAVIDNNASDGRYTAIVPFGNAYELSVNHPAYETKKVVVLDSEMVNCTPLRINISLQKVEGTASSPTALAVVPPVRMPISVTTPPKETPENPTQVASINQPISKAKPIEEIELIADSPVEEQVKFAAEGEKQVGAKLIQNYALILKIVNKETGELINQPTFRLVQKSGEAYPENPQFNGQEYVFKIAEKVALQVQVEADGFLPFTAPLPELESDKKITIKLAPKLKNTLLVRLLSQEDGQLLAGEVQLKQVGQEVNAYSVKSGELKLDLTKGGKWVVAGEAQGYLPLQKEVDIVLTEAGGVTVEVELKLVRNDYLLQLESIDLETGLPLAGAVFYVKDAQGNKVLELLADNSGKVNGRLTSKGPFTVQCLADGFNLAEQVITELLPTTTILFKSVKEKVSMNEVKVVFIDRYTKENALPSVLIDQTITQKAPFFLKGKEGQIFSLEIKDKDFTFEKYKLAFNDSLMNKVSTILYAQRAKYDFYFSFYDKQTKKQLPRVILKMIDLTDKSEVQSFAEGEFMASLRPDRFYAFQVSAAGYQSVSQKISAMTWIQEGEFEKMVLLTPEKQDVAAAVPEKNTEVIRTVAFGTISKGTRVTLENIYFDQSSPVLRKESFTQLDELAKVLQENPALKIEIRGHTDNVGDFYENVKLSKARCESVITYLLAKKIEASRLIAVGRGSVEPIAPNDTEANKKRNRRVEFIVL